MEEYQKKFARALAESGALFFGRDLKLKDGRPSPYFVNIGLFKTGRLSFLLGSYLASMIMDRDLLKNIDVLIGPSYKGSSIAAATAIALWTNHEVDMLFDYDRKEAKTHGEASAKKNMFVTNALFPHAKVFILDDVATTMGTKYDLIDLLNEESADKNLDLTMTGVGLAVDREQTTAVRNDEGELVEGVKGADTIAEFNNKTGLDVHFLVGIKDVVSYLMAEKVPVMINGTRQPIDSATKQTFDEYIDMYGIDPR